MSEPVVYAIFTAEGNIRIWSAKHDKNILESVHGEVTALYPESALTAEREARVKAEAALARVRETIDSFFVHMDMHMLIDGAIAYIPEIEWNNHAAVDDARALAAEKGADHE